MSVPDSAILLHLHHARLNAYRNGCDASDPATLALYLWNLDLSSAAQKVLAITEVVLRNAIDQSLRNWNVGETTRTEDWLLAPAHPLDRLTENTREEAARRARNARTSRPGSHPRRQAPVDHNDMLVQLTLGSWNNLLPIRNRNANTFSKRRYLWHHAIKNAFPHLQNDSNGYGTAARVGNLLTLRNRVSHMEPLLDIDMVQRYNDVLTLLASINPDLKPWMANYSQLLTIYNQRP